MAAGISRFLCRSPDEASGKFLMLPPEILEEEAFQKLTHAARLFLIVIHVHRQTEQQRRCLREALGEYNEYLGLGMTEEDIKDEAEPTKKTKYNRGYVVIPQKHLAQYGYSASRAYKLKQELLAAGFLEVAYNGKGRLSAWNQNLTVYRLSERWKNKT